MIFVKSWKLDYFWGFFFSKDLLLIFFPHNNLCHFSLELFDSCFRIYGCVIMWSKILSLLRYV